MNESALRRLVRLFAVLTGGVVANTYLSQPLLEHMALDLGVSPGMTSLVPGASQFGYALGMLLLAPMGDRIDRRRIILGQFLLLVPALLVAAVSPNLPVLVAASLGIGFAATIVQQIIPLTVTIATPERTGRVVGVVMTGLTLGILLSRPIAGLIDTSFGWRACFAFAALVAALLAMLAWLVVPSTTPASRISYLPLLATLPELLRSHAPLRRAALSGLLWSAAFNAFWSVLAFRLSAPPFDMGSVGAGLFGFAALGGALISRPAGRLADRHGPRWVLGCALVGMLVAFALMAVAGGSLLALLAATFLLDAGVFAAQIGNQSILLRLRGPALSRINAIYMVCYCLGGAAGATIAGSAWNLGGWLMVCCLGFMFCTLSLAVSLGRKRDTLPVGKRLD